MISGKSIQYSLSPIFQLVDSVDEEFDVLVMDSFIRTFKLLFAVSKGIPVVSKAWLSDSTF